jgi:hypothetical protein
MIVEDYQGFPFFFVLHQDITHKEAKKTPVIKNTILFICPVRRANNPILKIFI